MNETAIERALGPTEEMYWRFDALSPLNFAVAARFVGPLSMEHLRRGIDALQQRHPLLRVRVALDSKGVPWFRSGVGPIRLQVLDATVESTWSSVENCLEAPLYTSKGPLTYFVLLRNGPEDATLLSVFHHAISDGRSATLLLRDLLQSLALQHAGQPPTLTALAPAGYYGDRIPPLDTNRGMESLRNAWKTLKASALFMRRVGLPVGLNRATADASVTEGRRIYVEPRFLEAPELARLVQRAKQERTTVQCALNAALSLSVAEDSPTRPFERTGCTQVIDLRARLIPPIGEDCGLFATGITSLHQADHTTEFWPFAREIREHMDHSIATPLPFFHPAVHNVLTNLAHGIGLSDPKKFSEVMNGLHPEGLAVSNLGRVDITVPGCPIRITELAFATNTSVLNDLSTSAVSYAGRMTWTFNGAALLTRERLARIADRAMTRLSDAIDGDSRA